MREKIHAPLWKGKTLRLPIPKGRDPFINTPLLPLGTDRDGVERFWISSCNSRAGCIGVMIDELGEHRICRFPGHGGFYSAAQEDADTLWLCGKASHVVRLSLARGKDDVFETGMQGSLVFAGMPLDPATGKLFLLAAAPPSTVAFSFDFRAHKVVKDHSGSSRDLYMRFSFPNGDGTYTVVVICPGVTFLRWDPRNETVQSLRLADETQGHEPLSALCYRMICDDAGCWYVPTRGWYDPIRQSFDDSGPKPQKEATWFARRGNLAYGCESEGERAAYLCWDMSTGAVKRICTIPDGGYLNTRLTASGKLVCVNVFGEFFRVDARSGALECSRRLPTDSIGAVDCLVRVDRERLLGTPFITQRFWEVNIRTGKGRDCGRAAPGYGEVLQTWKIGRKVYMAEYGGGSLVEYDPREHPHFPENPRVVADPPGGMRPVAAATDGRHIFYSCSAPYGILCSVLTKYDTKTGLATYAPTPLPAQMIRSLFYDRKTNSVLCGTTMHADCESRPPTERMCYVARLSAESFDLLDKAAAPRGAENVAVLGPLGGNEWLCRVSGIFEGTRTARWSVLRRRGFALTESDELTALLREARDVIYAGRAGLFVTRRNGKVELWDLSAPRGLGVALSLRPGATLRPRRAARKCLRELARDKLAYRIFVQDDSVYLVRTREVIILEGCLSGRKRGQDGKRGQEPFH